MTRDDELKQIEGRLVYALEAQAKDLTITAALSIAATTAHMIGMPKIELQKILIRCFDRRIAETSCSSTEGRLD